MEINFILNAGISAVLSAMPTIADPIAAPSYFGDLEQTFLRELEEVFSGAKEPQAAMDDAQAQVQSAIQ